MTTIIFSKGCITKREKNQSVKSHIKTHEKNKWVSEYMRIAQCSIQKAQQSFKNMEAVQNV